MNEEDKFAVLTAQINDIKVLIARMDQKLDSTTENHRDVRDDLKDHETRIRVLEKAKWLIVGAGAAGGGAAGALARTLLGG